MICDLNEDERRLICLALEKLAADHDVLGAATSNPMAAHSDRKQALAARAIVERLEDLSDRTPTGLRQ
jgi:hypothetical protein